MSIVKNFIAAETSAFLSEDDLAKKIALVKAHKQFLLDLSHSAMARHEELQGEELKLKAELVKYQEG